MRQNILKALIFLAFFLLGKHGTTAQTDPKAPATLTWGNDNNEPSNTMSTKLIGIAPDGFYVLRQKLATNMNSKPKFWVEHFNRDMKLLRSEELDLKYKRKLRDFEDVLYLGGKLYLLTSFNNTAKQQNYLFKQELSTKTLLPGKALDMIAQTDARNKEAEGTFAFAISKDSANLLVYKELPYQKKSPERFGFKVFDQNFQLVWEKNIVLPYNRYVVDHIRIEVRDGFIRKIEGGLDARLMNHWLESNRRTPADSDGHAISHLGWGTNPYARWDCIAIDGDDPEHSNGGTRGFAGNFLFSTGPNSQGGGSRHTTGHYDVPMKDCTVYLDDEMVLDAGRFVDPQMAAPIESRETHA